MSAIGALAGSRIGPLKETYVGSEPLLLWNGQNFLLASLDTSGYAVILYRVSAAGVQLDTQPVSVSASSKLSNLQGGASGQATGDAGGATGGSDGAAVDAGKPAIASASGCKCVMGRERRSSLPWSLLLPALVLLRRRRGRRQTR